MPYIRKEKKKEGVFSILLLCKHDENLVLCQINDDN